ncbi:hypothetical protein ACJZ2D_008828 [Fusarium nematophilum]
MPLPADTKATILEEREEYARGAATARLVCSWFSFLDGLGWSMVDLHARLFTSTEMQPPLITREVSDIAFGLVNIQVGSEFGEYHRLSSCCSREQLVCFTLSLRSGPYCCGRGAVAVPTHVAQCGWLAAHSKGVKDAVSLLIATHRLLSQNQLLDREAVFKRASTFFHSCPPKCGTAARVVDTAWSCSGTTLPLFPDIPAAAATACGPEPAQLPTFGAYKEAARHELTDLKISFVGFYCGVEHRRESYEIGPFVSGSCRPLTSLSCRLSEAWDIHPAASQLRIQSILSPLDPEVDESPNGSSNQSTPKRKFDEVLSAPGAVPSASHRAGIPDTRSSKPDVGAVELPGGHADEQRAMNHKSSKNRPPMRSSIACLRCRRSKIKCDNDGGNSPCDTCIKGGHQCQYPEATALPPKRNDPPTVRKQEKDGMHERKRTKRMDEGPELDSQKSIAYAEEVLAYPFLTTELWDQLLGIYRQHFATELSFLHLPTLKEKMSLRQGQNQELSSELNLVLLGVLTLTARFHPDLVKYVAHLSSSQAGSARSRSSQSKTDPVAASEFFAHALTAALGPLSTTMAVVTVERVQAFLMLGLFEWSQGHTFRGSSAWMYVGVAIRMAKLLRLGLDDQLFKGQAGSTVAPHESRRSPSEIGIIRECRRRTMYSCLILDRLMACGDDRTTSIRMESVRIQLPCSDMAFDLALDVHTGFLKRPDEVFSRQINDDSTLNRFVRLIEIWGEISIYSSTGGRLRGDMSTFRRLREKLDRFQMELPDTFILSRQNYYRHDNHQATNAYVSLHMLASVCQIVLDREYLPFLPIGCRKPEGPLDEHVPTNEQIPDRFWEDCADNVFRAARDVIDLAEICRDKLPQSSLTVFSVSTAGFLAVYAHHFPAMDTQQRMSTQGNVGRYLDEDEAIFEEGPAGTAYQVLQKMATYLPVTQNYLTQLGGMNQYFTRVKRKIDQHLDSGSQPPSERRRLSIRPGGNGGLGDYNSRGDNHDEISPTHYGQQYPRGEGSDRSRDSTQEPLSSTRAPEGSQSRLGCSQDHSISPTISFAKLGNPSGARPSSVESPPVVQEFRREGLSTKGSRPGELSKLGASVSKSQLLLPGIDDMPLERSVPEFSTEKLEAIKSQRIAAVLNDLEEFSGADSRGIGIHLAAEG